jgi:hypothetical protein
MDEEMQAEVLAGATSVLHRLRDLDGAITTTLRTIQRLDKEHPKLTSEMRAHGLVQEMSSVATAVANLEIATGDLFKSLKF